MELEAKFKCNDLSTPIEKVKELGFELEKKKDQIDTYFIVNGKKEDGTRHYLRTRKDNLKGIYSLDYHIVLSLLETDETEIYIENEDRMMKILGLLGYEVKCVVNKYREQYKKGKVKIIFDKVANLGNFIEIEINDSLTEENEKLINDMIKSLKLDEKDRVVKKGYPDLLIEKKLEEENDSI